MQRRVIRMRYREAAIVYAVGSVGYRVIELLWRGRTHWTMGICGGVCFLLIYALERRHTRLPLACRALLSTLWITAVEFFSGLLINRVFDLGVWDYSAMRVQLCGQISLAYSLLWYCLCIPAHLLSRIIMRRIFGAMPTAKLKTANFLKGDRVFGGKQNERAKRTEPRKAED